MKSKGKTALTLLRATWNEWREDEAPHVAAALAYYTVFSLAPLLLVIVAVVGIVLGEEAARGEVLRAAREFMGPSGAQAIEQMVRSSSDPEGGRIALIAGIVGLLVGASTAAMHLKESLNVIWELPRRKREGIVGMLRTRVLSLAVVLTIGFLLLASLAVSAAIAAVGKYLADRLQGGELLWQVVDFSLSVAVATVLFGALFKFLPDLRVEWRDVWTGALFTAVLFVIGKTALAMYIGKQSFGSTFGAAASFVILLIWIYYSALIFFFGAEFTQVHAKANGRAPGVWHDEEEPGEPSPTTDRAAAAAAPRRAGGGGGKVGAFAAGSLGGCILGSAVGALALAMAATRSLFGLFRRS